MIYINDNDLKNFYKGNSGTFGTIYRVNDSICYKIYREYYYDQLGHKKDNPCLNKNNLRLKRELKRRNKIKNTDLLYDYVFINGRFGGIKLSFYDGVTLNNLMNESFELKFDISNQLINNSRELTDNNIYPLDYKLNNLMYSNNKVKIIDLDDTFTKVTLFPNSLYKAGAISGLNDTIRAFFHDYEYRPFSRNLYDKLGNNIGDYSNNYDNIMHYLNFKNIDRDFLLIDSNSNIDYLTSFLSNHVSNIIYLYDLDKYDDDYFSKLIMYYNSIGINLFDLVHNSKIDAFFNDIKSNNIIELKDKQFILKK